MPSFSCSSKVVYGALQQPGSKPCPPTSPKKLWLFLIWTDPHNQFNSRMSAARYARGQLTVCALPSGRWSLPGTEFSSCFFLCAGVIRRPNCIWTRLCSQESNGSSWGLASPPAEGRQLRLVIPWTATVRFDKALLAEHFVLYAFLPP